MGFLADIPLPEGMGRVTIDYATNAARLVRTGKTGLDSVPIQLTPELRQALRGAPYMDVRLEGDSFTFPLPVPPRNHLGKPYGVYSAVRMAKDAEGAPATWRLVEQRVASDC